MVNSFAHKNMYMYILRTSNGRTHNEGVKMIIIQHFLSRWCVVCIQSFPPVPAAQVLCNNIFELTWANIFTFHPISCSFVDSYLVHSTGCVDYVAGVGGGTRSSALEWHTKIEKQILKIVCRTIKSECI